jgi:hypothetical protein
MGERVSNPQGGRPRDKGHVAKDQEALGTKNRATVIFGNSSG